jgi:hypothetical protein
VAYKPAGFSCNAITPTKFLRNDSYSFGEAANPTCRPEPIRVRALAHLTTARRTEQPMTSQHHESMKTLISGLNITSYQGLLKTTLDKVERQTIQTLLREEEIWLKQHTPNGNSKPRPSAGRRRHS